MTSIPSAIRQIGYVVPDLEAALAHWLGKTAAGPFVLMPDQRFAGWSFHGEPQDLVLDIAFGQIGDMMLELIQPRGPWPNVYGERPPQDAPFVHHFGFLVDDMDRASAAIDAPLITSAQIDDSAELRYFDVRSRFGVHFELITDTPSVRAFFDLSEGLTRDWDGKTVPVRRFEDVAS